MHLKRKIVSAILSIGLCASGLGFATPSFADNKHRHDNDHKHGHGSGSRQHSGSSHPHKHGGNSHQHSSGGHDNHNSGHHHHHNGWAIGLGVGALVGTAAIASAESSHHNYRNHNCHQTKVERHCYTNEWGDYICHRVQYVRNLCYTHYT